jgi:chromosomal replication initiator protein
MYFSKKLTKHSLSSIGSEHGGKNHATVLHAIKTINDLYDTDRRIRYDIQTLETLFKIKFKDD